MSVFVFVCVCKCVYFKSYEIYFVHTSAYTYIHTSTSLSPIYSFILMSINFKNIINVIANKI